MTRPARSTLVYLSSCAAALALGGFGGYRILHCRYINQKVDQLFNPPQPQYDITKVERQLSKIRRTLNDTHKRVSAVSKGIEIKPS